MTTPSQETLRAACNFLAKTDRALRAAYERVDLPQWRVRPATYETLAQIVVYQLISTKAADAIWARVLARHPRLDAQAIISDDQDALRACGLSRPKLAHLNAIAEAVDSGVLDFDELARLPVDDTRTRLLSVKGIGPWTAETFLMNALGHLDAFPHGDVGLMEAYKRVSGATERMDAKVFSIHAENWKPYRAVAAHLLYDWLHSLRS